VLGRGLVNRTNATGATGKYVELRIVGGVIIVKHLLLVRRCDLLAENRPNGGAQKAPVLRRILNVHTIHVLKLLPKFVKQLDVGMATKSCAINRK
jgi:hypothetical protein